MNPQKKQKAPLEKDVKDDVKGILRELGLWHWMPSAGLYGRRGASDFILPVAGRMVVIETKKGDPRLAKFKPSPMQQDFMDNVVKAGGAAFVIWPGNIDTLRKLLLAMLDEEELIRC